MKKDVYLQIRKAHSFEIKNSFLLRHLIADFSILSLSIYLCRSGGFVKLLAIPLLATFMFRSFSFMHEAVHGLVSNNKKLNDAIGILYAAFSVLPFSPWKKSHLDHHFWSGNYQKDPVMALITILPKWSERSVRILNFLWRSWVPVLAFMQYVVFWMLSIKTTFAGKKPIADSISIFFPIILFVSLFTFLSASTIFQVILPAVTLYLMAVDVVNLPHHLQLPMISGEQKLTLWEQHAIARTCLYPKWIASFIVLNFNYHSEHHMYPDAPWYCLDKLHKAVQQELGSQQHLDPSFKWILDNRPKSLLEVIQTNEITQSVKKAS